jgi:hypothetical protein
VAQITCSKSGVVFSCEHMPVSLSSREYSHPLFSISKKRLISLSAQWAAGKLSPTENYLLYLSLLNSTDLVQWRVPALYTTRTQSIVANNMESLIHIIGKIDVISHPSFALPSFAITSDTSTLENSFHWIQSWIANYNDWYDGLRDSSRRESYKAILSHREESLQRLIKTAYTRPEDLAVSLSKWARLAGDFPEGSVPHPHTHKQISVADYWEQIIRACASDDAIWKYPKVDLEELIDHCEDNVIHGSIYASSLMRLLRGGLRKQVDYLGFGDIDLAGRKTTFVVLSPETSVEDANKLAAIQSAPTSEPRIGNYPNKFSYLRAKANWDMKRRFNENGGKL